MPHLVKLNLTAADFRQHPATEAWPPHWLTNSIYGRELLKTKLRLTHPDLRVQALWDPPEHEQLLESMVDVLDLRDWPQPTTFWERFAAVRWIVRMTLELREGREPPSWSVVQKAPMV
jgi:hypothetical protein